MAQSHVFEDSEELLGSLLGSSISAKQIQRVSEHYGERLEALSKSIEEGVNDAPALETKPSDAVYAMVDGSMVFTREEGWKEMKMGRIYAESSRVAIQSERTAVTDSLYVCHLGGHQDFLNKFDPYLDHYKNKVLIADGAKWIWNWADDFQSDAVQILDFFHAVEKLSMYAALEYEDNTKRKQWLDRQKQRLKNNGVTDIINELSGREARNGKSAKALTDVIGYYRNNSGRMQYKTYLEKGYLIGSGAIESANRNVIQQRMKLSGQRWSIDGLQRIANLRACKKGNQWNTLMNCIKNAA